jgi:excisionase family DNA binding protein
MKKTYSTSQAAKLIGVHVVTLKRWLADRKMRTSVSMPTNGRTYWRFTRADVGRFRKFKALQRPGPKKRKK